jgi:hypothetical protein
MATSTFYLPPVTPGTYQTPFLDPDELRLDTTDPRKVSKAQRYAIQTQGQFLADQAAQQQAREEALRQQSADYLGGIEAPIAEGRGGYSAEEAAAIQDQLGLAGLYNESAITPSAEFLQSYTDPSAINELYNPEAISPSEQFLSEYQVNPNEAATYQLGSEEMAQRELTPEQQQRMVTAAGISAGAGAQAAKDAVARAVAASGGNPTALAAYRSRMDRQGAGEAADAMTQARMAAETAARNARIAALDEQRRQAQAGYGTAAARGLTAEQLREQGGQNVFNEGLTTNETAAQRALTGEQLRENAGQVGFGQRAQVEQAGSGRAADVANQRLQQQQNALGYYQGQNAQANQNAQNAAQRAQQTYATQSGGTNEAANIGLAASQTPTKADKVLGAISGALQAVAEGDPGSGGSRLRIVGESGPEMVRKVGDYRGRRVPATAPTTQPMPMMGPYRSLRMRSLAATR